MTETDIANLALSLIGGKPLTALDTDNTPQAISCRKWFDAARDEAQSGHPWNFASRRARLTLTWVSLVGVALTDNGSGLIRVAHTGHGYQTGNRITIKDTQGVNANGSWYITRIDDNTFDLQDSSFSGSHTSGTGSFIKVPLFGWDYEHTAPDECLRVVNLNGNEANENDSKPFAFESGKLLTNEETVELRYVHRNETTTEWSQPFINAFSFLLASYIAQDLTGPAGKAAEMRQRYEASIAPQARTHDARQGKGRVVDPTYNSDVVRARRGFIS